MSVLVEIGRIYLFLLEILFKAGLTYIGTMLLIAIIREAMR